MRKKRTFRKKHTIININVVPYIDVMLVLLVIFMITTPILTQGVKVSLPEAKSEKISLSDSKPIVITVNEQGQYFINQGISNTKNPVSPSQLQNIVINLAKINNKPVYIRGDEAASYGEVVKAMALIQNAGIKNIGLVTKDENS